VDPADANRGWWARQRFAVHIALATGAAVLVGLATAALVSGLIGPGIFDDHLAMTGETDPGVVAHVVAAFGDASLITLGVGLAVGAVTAGAVSLWLGRWVSRALDSATSAAEAVAAGDYDARIPDLGLGADFRALAEAFNSMAADLDAVEASRRRVLSDLAHEMRTPVAALRAYHEAIADGVRPADDATMAVLQRHTARLARLAEDVALVTSAEEGRLTMAPTPVRVAALVEAAVAGAAPLAEAVGARVDADVAGWGDLVLMADPERLGEVLTNLLDNALRLVGPGGVVQITADSDDDTVVLTVTDDGVGIAAEHLPHLFDRFYRVDDARDRDHGGSGIGLAIVKAIVTAHGGRVAVDSPGLGRGATLTVWLPRFTGF
jgi:signal transduction histidine kinase